MKDTFYFPHDYHARTDLKIQALIDDYGPAGYGLFWAITELLHEDEDHCLILDNITTKAIAKQMSTSVEQVNDVIKSCLDYGLLIQNGNDKIYSDRVNKNIGRRIELSEKRSKAGKISAEKRLNQTHAEQVLTSVQQNPTKERKEKERKEKNNGYDPLTDGGWEKDKVVYDYLCKFFPKLFKLKNPLSYQGHINLIEKFGKEAVKDIYASMQNYAPLLKNNEDAYLTAIKWLKKDATK